MVSNTLKISENKLNQYPKAIAFIISNEFCERFNYYGMRTILSLYLINKLHYSEDDATILFHVFACMAYLFPLVGAIVADSFLGRFRTIFYLSIVYAIGSSVLSLGAIPTLQLNVKYATCAGLLLIALGTGGIKPCVSAFGGDQFKLPDQATQLARFFSIFYFSINAGALISSTLTPNLRQDVHCFGQKDCFSLAFGVPAVLMIVSVVIFLCGKPFYKMVKPAGNMLVKVSQCIWEAIKKRISKSKEDRKAHWLDYAEEKYGTTLVNDTKALLRILLLYIPLPMFWALFDQQGSRWTFQATRMDGQLGNVTIKPDQMQVTNALLILVFIPIFEYIVYPILSKCGIRRPLQKLVLGGLLAALAFALSGLVEIAIEKSTTSLLKENELQLNLFNAVPCDYEFHTNIPNYEKFVLKQSNSFDTGPISIANNQTRFEYEAKPILGNCSALYGELELSLGNKESYFLRQIQDKNNTNKDSTELIELHERTDFKISPHFETLTSANSITNVELKNEADKAEMSSNNSTTQNIASGEYDIFVNGHKIKKVNIKPEEFYTLFVDGDEDRGYDAYAVSMKKPKNVHILWQIPQYMVMTAAEVMFSITGLEFSFTQAPSSMKSVLQAIWLLTVAVGNFSVVLITELNFFSSHAATFFFFAIMMCLDMGILSILAYRYKYVQLEMDTNENIEIQRP